MLSVKPVPRILEGHTVRLEPLTLAHVPDLFRAGGGDEEVWRWLNHPMPRTEAELREIVAGQLADEAKEAVLWAAVLRETGRAVGQTSYLDISVRDERLEIGGTWYGRQVWRTAVNTEAKLLLLTHAFEDLGVGRVQWKTHHLNARSQEAIARLGAHREGVLRRHMAMPDGTWRDSVYYSMLADEWPPARDRLRRRLAAGGQAEADAAGPGSPGDAPAEPASHAAA
ncbi:GNAT family N-acetyltransferase [Streptomyces buecherae]|uniref:GNAT family N-acetyltransferase n=1 Tax=Streptomyces buecherae TaxID=2763006 RepID=A0A7H8NB70_9ACTN|nr:GNAT family protein [Streptomyces buecherae]QKW51596.1 GNAT family N-acetyltransferase [Streptomyces buecherae]